MRSIQLLCTSLAALGLFAAACGASPTNETDESDSATPSEVRAAAINAPRDVLGAIQRINACESRDGFAASFPIQSIAMAHALESSSGASAMRYVARYAVLHPSAMGAFSSQEGANACEAPIASDAIGLVRIVLQRGMIQGPLEPGKAEHVGSGVQPAKNPKQELGSSKQPITELENDALSIARIFTDVCGLETIKAESGWYEAWLVHDLRVPPIAAPGAQGYATPGTITQQDADALKDMGAGNNVPGAVFTMDGNVMISGQGQTEHGESNTLSIPISIGTFNTLLGSDGHASGELSPSTNWSFPLYELAATGGRMRDYQEGNQYGPLGGHGLNVDSRIPGSGPLGILNNASVQGKVSFGDNPENPRDADRNGLLCLGGHPGSEHMPVGTRIETRLRGLPSGLAREVLIEAFMRPVSSGCGSEPSVERRLERAYGNVVARFDLDENGVLSFDEALRGLGPQSEPAQMHTPYAATARAEPEIHGASNLFIPFAEFDRVVVTREINDGLLAPRFAPNHTAEVLEGRLEMHGANAPTATQTGGATHFGTSSGEKTTSGSATGKGKTSPFFGGGFVTPTDDKAAPTVPKGLKLGTEVAPGAKKSAAKWGRIFATGKLVTPKK